jgi:predicted MFS family arabinose efflux permease
MEQNATKSTAQVPVWRATLSAASASLIGIGLARFAYTPLLPAIIDARWFSASQAAYLGAANLAGYLLGVLFAGHLARRTSARTALRAMMSLTTLAIFACAWPMSLAWFFTWRLVSGIGGGAIMLLAAPAVLPHVSAARRGVVSGLIFMGIGVGVAASGTLVPLLLRQGLMQAWFGIGITCLLLTAIAWGGWPDSVTPGPGRDSPRKLWSSPALRGLYLEYGLNAFGLVPHMIFLVVFVAHGLGQGLEAGASYWVLFGLGAVVGPLLSGYLADRLGFRAALRLAFGVQAAAVLAPSLDHGTATLIISSFIMGASTPGIVPLVLGRVHELAGHHPDAQRAAWRAATTAFACAQALAGYAMSFLLARTGGAYPLLFELGAGSIVLALLIDVVANRRTKNGDEQARLRSRRSAAGAGGRPA